MKRTYVFYAKSVAIAAALPFLVYAFASGPEPGHTGAPGEKGTCTACHAGTANSGPGSVRVEFPGGENYTPGATQRLRVVVSDPDQVRWGFQLTARRAADAASQAGSFTPADANSQVICADSGLNQQTCSAATPLQYIEHTQAGTRSGTRQSAAFEFDWTPPSTDVGNIVIYVAGNAANGNNFNSGDRIYTRSYTLAPQAASQKPSISAEGGVVNGATFQPGIAAGSWVTIKGSNFGSNTRVWQADEIVNGKLPTSLDGVSVTINGKPASVYYISPGQINVQAPSDDSTGPVPVEVTVNGVKSDAVMGNLQRFSPGFFPWPGNQAVATDANFNWRAKADTFPGVTTTPAKPGEVIILWGTGFGPTNPAIPAGQVVDQATTLAEAPVIRVGGQTAEFLGGALTQGSAGLYQIVIRIPESAPDGDLPVVAEVGGVRSPENIVITVRR
ncbi:MAG: IPT/TIG domain-containing protein [Bryobacterales bacterium]|nr:IPT/TIG domain-containing protein [Bryobacterales bacterium]